MTFKEPDVYSMTPASMDTISHDPTPGISSTAQSSAAISTGSPFKDKLIAALEIPMDLTDHTDRDLGFAFQKYKACEAAVKTCNNLWNAGKLRDVFDKKPSQADIISIFKGKTQYHTTYKKAFPKLSKYPEMVTWLENGSDKLSDLELWGVVKNAYTFSDLFDWMDNDGKGLDIGTESEEQVAKMKKGKGKGKLKGEGKDKDKGKGKDKDKGKGKDKDKGKGKDKDKGKGKDRAKDKGQRQGQGCREEERQTQLVSSNCGHNCQCVHVCFLAPWISGV